MTKLEAALLDITSFLEARGIPHMLIGGFANLHWGAERFTRDLDLTIEVTDEMLPDLLRQLAGHFRLAPGDPLAFARRNHLIRLDTRTGVPVDLILAALPYERAALRRAVAMEVAGREVRLCSPEDLIIHKLASERPQDALDVEGIVRRQVGRLDRAWLDARVRELARGLERPEVMEFYERLLNEGDAPEPGGSDG